MENLYTDTHRHRGKVPIQDGGGDCSDAPTSQGVPESASNCQKPGDRPGPPEETNPDGTSIWDF